VTRGLAWTEVATIAEDGEQIALDGLRQFWVGPRRGAKMPGVTGPVFGMLENVQEVALRHARTELLLEGRQSGWLGGCCDLPEMRCSVVRYTEFGVVGQAGVDGGGHGG
jgi:hypothetical protein